MCVPVFYNHDVIGSRIVECRGFSELHVERWQFFFSRVAPARFWPEIMLQEKLNIMKSYSKSNMLQEQYLNTRCSKSISHICSWSIFDLEYYSRLLCSRSILLEHT